VTGRDRTQRAGVVVALLFVTLPFVVRTVQPALQEVQRYTFRSPGQATSYFCGYTRLMELRQETERALGPKFDRRTYHDFLLAQGLLPPSLLRKAVFEEFVPRQLKK
jgi:uncharacterized protein (DUF885 family)